jgi:dolichol-phosphate mannosyltransferase
MIHVQKNVILSVVVACYNDENVIRLTHAHLIKILGKQPSFDLEIIYIDDGSKDKTYSVLVDLAREDNRVTVISLARNFGQQAAISAGLKYAKGDAVAIMDSDLQDPPEIILQMFNKWKEGYEVVYGIRQKRKESFLRRLCYFIFYRIMRNLSNIEIPADSGDFSLMDRKVVNILNALPERNRFVRGLRAWCGFSQYGLPYERMERVAGESYYSLQKTINLAMNGFFNFSVRPLSIITLVGSIASLLSFILLVFFAVHRMVGFKIFGYTPADVPGFTSIILSLLFFSGVQLLSIGILGEYIGRLYEEVKNRPAYLVDNLHSSSYKAPHSDAAFPNLSIKQ